MIFYRCYRISFNSLFLKESISRHYYISKRLFRPTNRIVCLSLRLFRLNEFFPRLFHFIFAVRGCSSDHGLYLLPYPFFIPVLRSPIRALMLYLTLSQSYRASRRRHILTPSN
jgi:hypothetical protein